jgi:hypothetical protein
MPNLFGSPKECWLSNGCCCCGHAVTILMFFRPTATDIVAAFSSGQFVATILFHSSIPIFRGPNSPSFSSSFPLLLLLNTQMRLLDMRLEEESTLELLVAGHALERLKAASVMHKHVLLFGIWKLKS